MTNEPQKQRRRWPGGVDVQGEWSLKLSNGLSIELGRNHLEKRLNSSMVVYNSFDGVFEARSSFIDARYMGGVAFRRSDLGDSGSNFWFSNID